MENFYKDYEKLRLKPNHEVSQWYMKISDVKKQVEFLYKNVSAKRILFLGDGDGISILFALKLLQEKNSAIEEILVLDIDERELNLYNKISEKYGVNKFVKFKTKLYNISDKVPEEYQNYFDFFYINPPYSYITNPIGLGFMLWLDRCIELSKPDAVGCIVYPISHGDKKEVAIVKENLQKYLEENKFEIKLRPNIKHKYSESECISKNLIVKRTKLSKSAYKNEKIPYSVIKSMYPRTDNPPYLIYDDGSTFGNGNFYF